MRWCLQVVLLLRMFEILSSSCIWVLVLHQNFASWSEFLPTIALAVYNRQSKQRNCILATEIITMALAKCAPKYAQSLMMHFISQLLLIAISKSNRAGIMETDKTIPVHWCLQARAARGDCEAGGAVAGAAQQLQGCHPGQEEGARPAAQPRPVLRPGLDGPAGPPAGPHGRHPGHALLHA